MSLKRPPFLRDLPAQQNAYDFLALATYNGECARGIVHTPEYDKLMAQEQERFNSHRVSPAGFPPGEHPFQGHPRFSPLAFRGATQKQGEK